MTEGLEQEILRLERESLSSPSPSLRGLLAWGTWGSGAARPRHTERIVYVVGGQLGAEARVWDHQRPLGVKVLRQRGDSWGLGEPGGDGRLRVRLRQGVVMPFIESTWTYFFFIFLVAAILKFEDLWVVGG